jgi:site-specific DNA-methyltransferase (adenine-specific)
MLCYLIGNSSKRGDVVLDTFGGSGSTLIACERTGRVCRCVELDPKYCDVIRRRWAEFVHGEGCDWEKLTPPLDSEHDTPEMDAGSAPVGATGESVA